jgi:anti-sigma factor RsiW
MMTGDTDISEEDLHAFIDGELDPARAAEIAARLERNISLAERVAAFRNDRAKLAQIYGSVAAQPLPDHWLRLIDERASVRPGMFANVRRSQRMVAALAAGLLLVLGLGLAYEGIVTPREDTIIAEALAARQNVIMAQSTFAGPALPAAADANKIVDTALAMNLKIPDLARMGYRLADIRVYADVPGGKAVQIDYRNAQNTVFTLYLRHPSGPAKVDLLKRGDTRICLWQDDMLGSVMTGEMSAGEMARLASLAYSGLYL